MTVKERLGQAIASHIQKDSSLITGTERLLNEQIEILCEWLTENVNDYKEQDMHEEALAIKDLITQIRE